MKKTICTSLLLLLMAVCGISQTKQLDLGDKVPIFNLPNQAGKNFSMKDSVGSQVIVIFFYPKAEKKEVCAFSDSIAKFNEADALVIGISGNDVQKVKKFHDTYKLKYDLLSDSNQAVLKSFGVKENLFSNKITYVINIAGEVVYKNYSLTDGKKQVADALKFLRQMKQ